ncbi:hypothetical protein [Phenylobacterium sp.]|uniref:hypothetical protein n=1 Tax=Phenylobacterium sp. TaxID=1871053 RepID=UPI0012255118|nr:hypothetical protein [Phenylobacterium sp.]THD63703.1 MAG: hypothetical protein E8A49_04930 [Phenylobacterium sp.]
MNKTTPALRKIAKRLILFEWPSVASSASAAASEDPVIERLRPRLRRLMGHGGTRALLARALIMASSEAPWLSAAFVTANGDLEGFERLKSEIAPTTFLEGRVIFLAQLLGLLVTFIGPTLTSGLVGEIWPHIALKERDFGTEQ